MVGDGFLINDIASQATINVQDFLNWNGLASADVSLWKDYWYCIGV
jgi:hypothetical protein